MKTPRAAIPKTDCNHQPLLFQDLGPRQVVADFSGGYLSSDGGALLLRQIDRGLGLTRTLARELGDRNIRVNCIVPGAIVTERQKQLWLKPDDDQRFLDLQCLKIRLQPEEVARAALFLASDEARGITGQNIIVDAGIV